ncbi:MAG: hypothetical protein Q8R47_03300 [Nanoarchaeota archaeon]|nr:hypothetical protein [Nanoarchaeota archaeon]
MVANKRICMYCNVPIDKTAVEYKGKEFEARQCPRCKENIFTEDLAMKAIAKLGTKESEQTIF